MVYGVHTWCIVPYPMRWGRRGIWCTCEVCVCLSLQMIDLRLRVEEETHTNQELKVHKSMYWCFTVYQFLVIPPTFSGITVLKSSGRTCSYDQPTGCNDVRIMIQTMCLENLVYLEPLKLWSTPLSLNPCNATAKVWKFWISLLTKTIIAGFIAKE